MKNLIVYYSYEGNTKEIANELHHAIKADILNLF